MVAANLLAAEAAGVSGAVLNVATGRSATVLELAETIGALLDRAVEREHLGERTGDVRDSWADIRRAGSLLGYRPVVTLEDGLRHTAEAFLGAPEQVPLR